MASNPTPLRVTDIIAAGEDLCDGLGQIGAALGVTQNTFAKVRADLDALLAAQAAFVAAQGDLLSAHEALRTADGEAKGFFARAVKVISITLGNDWSDAWLATGLPDNIPGIPSTQAKRFAALGSLRSYFTVSPAMENAPLTVTAAQAGALYEAVSDARQAVGNATRDCKAARLARDAALGAFRRRFRGTLQELGQLLPPADPRWLLFGLSRPADPSRPGIPKNVRATALGGGRVLVRHGGATHAKSFDFYRQVAGTDAEPVKGLNTAGTQHAFEGLPAGATVGFTVTGVNSAGEGPPSRPVSVVVE